MPSFAPKIRVEVYLPVGHKPAYQDTLTWLIDELTELCGGCTLHEDSGGYYLSDSGQVIADRVNMVYSDFPMNWNDPTDQESALDYCAKLQSFLLENLWEEEILIAAYPTSHVIRQ
ncbi:MAG TPA: hypothetical protein VJT71_20455 [Pyrinomonadaceae bacterium]|nr:hypothetical protein [Pyrinomonadaceae bacterium]